MLLISDVHLGKVSHFRKFGAAVPRRALHKNFILLDQVAARFQPFQICFLGDLFHSHLNQEWALFENWVARTPAELVLIAGNHDIIAPEKFEGLGITMYKEWLVDDFLLTHHPENRAGYFNFSGHIHPSIRLKGAGRQSLRLACFFKTPSQMVLPAFGTFTGTHAMTPSDDEQVFAIANGHVLPI